MRETIVEVFAVGDTVAVGGVFELQDENTIVDPVKTSGAGYIVMSLDSLSVRGS